MKQTVIVTGGAGFIGSHFVELLAGKGYFVVVVDALKIGSNPDNIAMAVQSGNAELVAGDINDSKRVAELLAEHKPVALFNFAAETHVDRSISGAAPFIESNINGVYSLLEASLKWWQQLDDNSKQKFRFVQISTDEVFGELGDQGYFTEDSQIKPSSPYSASKAAGDHLVMAWQHTYDLPVIITHCSNNYGKRQFHEKLIPHMIKQALAGDILPIYGSGTNIRDWIYVPDHCHGIWLAWQQGRVGERYCFGGRAERRNIDVVEQICAILDELQPHSDGKSYREQISHVADRLGHDYRYAIDDSKAEQELGFTRQVDFETGLRKTIEWYLDAKDFAESSKH